MAQRTAPTPQPAGGDVPSRAAPVPPQGPKVWPGRSGSKLAAAKLGSGQAGEEATVAGLAEAQQATRRELGVLANRIGASTEEEAADVVRFLVEQKGLRVLGPERTVAVNGDVDVVLDAEAADGRRLTVLVEAKLRLSSRAVEAWASRVRDSAFRARLAAAGAPPPYLVYAYGVRVDASAESASRARGIGVATSRGEVVAPSAEIG